MSAQRSPSGPLRRSRYKRSMCARASHVSEIEPRRQLNHARRPCRVGDADRRAEGRVDLVAVRVEARGAVVVLDLELVVQDLNLQAGMKLAIVAQSDDY